MVTANTFPAPIGVTLSYSGLQAGTTTVNFQLEGGTYTVAFEAIDPNNPGVVTVNDANSNAVVTMRAPGYAYMFVPCWWRPYYVPPLAPIVSRSRRRKSDGRLGRLCGRGSGAARPPRRRRRAFSNISTTTAGLPLLGGLYGLAVIGTSFGSVTLQILGPDGSTYLTAATAITANGTALADLPPGTYRLALA